MDPGGFLSGLDLTLVMLNELICHAYFQFSANQTTWSRLLVLIHILNDKQCRSRSVGFFRSQLIWIYTVCKYRVYPGSAGQGLIILSYLLYIFGKTGLKKQCRPRSDTTHRAIWHTFTGSKMDLLKKKSIRKSVLILSNYPKFSMRGFKEGFSRTPRAPTEPAPA